MKNTKQRNAFTLVELLGVIILLGLVIMLVVPRVSSSIEKAEENAAIDSAVAYISAVRDYYNTNVLDDNCVVKNGENLIEDLVDTIKVKGEAPSSGSIILEENKIVSALLCVSNYYVTYDKGDVYTNGKCE